MVILPHRFGVVFDHAVLFSVSTRLGDFFKCHVLATRMLQVTFLDYSYNSPTILLLSKDTFDSLCGCREMCWF